MENGMQITGSRWRVRSLAVLAAFGVLGMVAAAEETETATDGASSYQDDWGPDIGTKVPALAATDQEGDQRDLASLSGENGFLLFVSRSAVW